MQKDGMRINRMPFFYPDPGEAVIAHNIKKKNTVEDTSNYMHIFIPR